MSSSKATVLLIIVRHFFVIDFPRDDGQVVGQIRRQNAFQNRGVVSNHVLLVDVGVVMLRRHYSRLIFFPQNIVKGFVNGLSRKLRSCGFRSELNVLERWKSKVNLPALT